MCFCSDPFFREREWGLRLWSRSEGPSWLLRLEGSIFLISWHSVGLEFYSLRVGFDSSLVDEGFVWEGAFLGSGWTVNFLGRALGKHALSHSISPCTTAWNLLVLDGEAWKGIDRECYRAIGIRQQFRALDLRCCPLPQSGKNIMPIAPLK